MQGAREAGPSEGEVELQCCDGHSVPEMRRVEAKGPAFESCSYQTQPSCPPSQGA